MLYYRRKIILALIEAFGGKVEAIAFQKLLFLLTRKQETKAFDFIPYYYGCFSFQANQDVMTLVTYGYLQVTEKEIVLEKEGDYKSLITEKDRLWLQETKSVFQSMSQDELVSYTYRNYPYFATKSKMAKRLLTAEELQKVENQKRACSEQMLFGLGYEGRSLENYLNTLIINDIRVLCDVRKNAFSQKYGFSKSQLEKACKGVGIQYVHIPQLGINSDKRTKLVTQQDYDTLFDEYEKTVLQQSDQALSQINELIRTEKRVVLMCFEKNPLQCHRTRILRKLINQPNPLCSFKNL